MAGDDNRKTRREVAGTALLGVVLFGTGAAMLVITLVSWSGSLSGQQGLGEALIAFLAFPLDPKLLTLIAAILAVAGAVLAGGSFSNRTFYGFVSFAAIDLVLAIILFITLGSESVAPGLYNHAPENLADAESFRSAVHWTFGGTALWLAGVLATLVGVRNPEH